MTFAQTAEATPSAIAALPIELDRTEFFNAIIRSLSGTLEETVGLEEASDFISIVGSELGDRIGAEYAAALGDEVLEIARVAEVLVDLKRRIGGGFEVVSADENAIVLSNSRCPFGENVKQRPSLCMMTTNVFGRIVSANTGYARVQIDEAIASGNPGCFVRVLLTADGAQGGHEFFG